MALLFQLLLLHQDKQAILCPVNAAVTLAGEGRQEKSSDKSHPDKYAVPGEDQIFWAPTDSALLVRMGYARLESEAPAEHFQASTIPPPRKSSALWGLVSYLLLPMGLVPSPCAVCFHPFLPITFGAGIWEPKASSTKDLESFLPSWKQEGLVSTIADKRRRGGVPRSASKCGQESGVSRNGRVYFVTHEPLDPKTTS